MNFTNYDHSFCEKQLWNIEYMNSFSSLAMSATGIYGFYFMPFISVPITLVYISLFLNGIGSFGYHWTNQIGWGLIDRMTMILMAISAYQIGLETVFKNKYMFLISQIYITSLLVVCGLYQDDAFNTLFGIFLGSLIFYIYMTSKLKLAEPKYIRKGYYGIGFMAIAGFFWIITEKYCHNLKYFPGHALWHIAISIGGHYILNLATNVQQKKEFQSQTLLV